MQLEKKHSGITNQFETCLRSIIAGIALSSAILLPSTAWGAERTYEFGPTSISWELTDAQVAEVDPWLRELRSKEKATINRILECRHKMDKLFMQPAPDRKAILALQAQIDDALEAQRLSEWTVALKIRSLLSAKQRVELGCLAPQKIVPGMSLTPAQTDSYYKIMRPYLSASLKGAEKLSALRLEQGILLQEMDLVHGCHNSKLDLPALVANQEQINAVKASMAQERLKIAISIHNLLTVEQKRQLLVTAAIQIPDPVGLSLDHIDRNRVPAAQQVYVNVTPTKEQVAKYNDIMDKEIAMSTAYRKMRDGLLEYRTVLLSKSELNIAALHEVQDKIIKIDGMSGIQRIIRIVKVREVLTPEQRHLVFNRHHPKIWKDTGINEKQDREIMAIHMKIEEADRAGKRKMTALSGEMERWYYDPAANDQQIMGAVRQYHQAQSTMVVAELGCLFAGRDVLNRAQREKLVALMAQNPVH